MAKKDLLNMESALISSTEVKADKERFIIRKTVKSPDEKSQSEWDKAFKKILGT